jgi:hypothetical protein
MATHPKARLGLAGRQALVWMIERGSSIRSATRTFNVSPATAHKWWPLRSHGISPRHRSRREEVRRYDGPAPGSPVSTPNFSSPGHAVTGDRFSSAAKKHERPGYEFCHSIVGGHTRLAYSACAGCFDRGRSSTC